MRRCERWLVWRRGPASRPLASNLFQVWEPLPAIGSVLQYNTPFLHVKFVESYHAAYKPIDRVERYALRAGLSTDQLDIHT